MKKSFFMNGSDTVLPTAPSRALRTLAQGAVAAWGTQSREPFSPARETGVSAVAVLAAASPGAGRAVSPAASRRRGLMTTESSVLPTEEQAKSGPTGATPKPPRTRRQTRKQFRQALFGLVYLAGIALGTLLLGGIVLHALVPTRQIDMFAALHNHIVLGVLLGLVTLWLLPPYPWAAPQPSTEPQVPAQSAGETEGDGASSATALSQYGAGSRLTGSPVQEGATV